MVVNVWVILVGSGPRATSVEMLGKTYSVAPTQTLGEKATASVTTSSVADLVQKSSVMRSKVPSNAPAHDGS